ncbi:MAG TPA: hydrolase 1, exosortase A system-associated [Sphingomonas sp.]|nr:hydrolase 1, exosortase A system-associated [Sphingomonas sp.]
MRELIAFDCAGETLFGTLDRAGGNTGLLIVSGGNEVRTGAHRGMAWLARQLAERGVPVLRFDRRGIGDSTGENGGYASSGPDIAAAAAAFRHHAPHVSRLIAFGNCDAATALALFGAGFDALILANPWVVEPTDGLPPAAAIEARYKERLRDPREWLRLFRGGVSFRKLFRGLRSIARSKVKHPDTLADRFFAALPRATTVILAERDATAQAFDAEAHRRSWPGTIRRIDTASHSFARVGDGETLLEAIFGVLAPIRPERGE